jgi:exopolyphosphatase/guanosine-5'-triphosphate,3'-diphosphate pyrophosphatase
LTHLRSSIDLGTNTCLLLVADWQKGSAEPTRVLGDYAKVVRLGQGVDKNRTLHPDAIERTLSCLRTYSDYVKKHGGNPSETLCVATSQARDAKNGAEFFQQVEKETGFKFRIISGDEEARMTFVGALLPDMKPESSAVIDIGGGSTEIISSYGGQSVDLGSVRFTERFLKSDPVTDDEFWACQEAIDQGLGPLLSLRERLPQSTALVAVAGTATTLAAWHLGLAHFDAVKIDRLRLSRGDIHRLVEELKWRTIEERTALPGVDAGRADVLLAGALILWRSMELLGFSELFVSTRGLRYGALK